MCYDSMMFYCIDKYENIKLRVSSDRAGVVFVCSVVIVI